jgi:hypothetical protein
MRKSFFNTLLLFMLPYSIVGASSHHASFDSSYDGSSVGTGSVKTSASDRDYAKFIWEKLTEAQQKCIADTIGKKEVRESALKRHGSRWLRKVVEALANKRPDLENYEERIEFIFQGSPEDRPSINSQVSSFLTTPALVPPLPTLAEEPLDASHATGSIALNQSIESLDENEESLITWIWNDLVGEDEKALIRSAATKILEESNIHIINTALEIGKILCRYLLENAREMNTSLENQEETVDELFAGKEDGLSLKDEIVSSATPNFLKKITKENVIPSSPIFTGEYLDGFLSPVEFNGSPGVSPIRQDPAADTQPKGHAKPLRRKSQEDIVPSTALPGVAAPAAPPRPFDSSLAVSDESTACLSTPVRASQKKGPPPQGQGAPAPDRQTTPQTASPSSRGGTPSTPGNGVTMTPQGGAPLTPGALAHHDETSTTPGASSTHAQANTTPVRKPGKGRGIEAPLLEDFETNTDEAKTDEAKKCCCVIS